MTACHFRLLLDPTHMRHTAMSPLSVNYLRLSQLSVDDFGTGYSSLSHIKHFPITSFKIDKSFIDGVPGDVADMAIVRAILALGSTLQVEIVAEGVETAEQALFLQGAGVNIIQGYFYGRPMPPDVLSEFLFSYLPPAIAK